MSRNVPSDPVLAALRAPRTVLALDADGWMHLIHAARRHGLLARLSADLNEAGLLEQVPGKAREQLAEATATAVLNRTVMGFEINRVRRALRGLDVPVVLLKGGAYLMAGLPAQRGRVAGDLDIMVPRTRLDEVERAMTAHGWVPLIADPYDQHYYRDWTHQIPPLHHQERRTELDIHHTIAPPTSRARPDTVALFQDARPLPDCGVAVLSPPDMVLHSAVHLFNEEMGMGLRNLFDLHDLLIHFGGQPGFWPALAARARLHGLGRPLFYCVHFCARVCGTPIASEGKAAVAQFGPGRLVGALMDWLVPLAILPNPPGHARRGAGLARWLLFVRAHWLKMPPGMLARHLAIKALRRARPAPPGPRVPAPRP